MPTCPFGDEDPRAKDNQRHVSLTRPLPLSLPCAKKDTPSWGCHSVPSGTKTQCPGRRTKARSLSPGLCHFIIHVLKRMPHHGFVVVPLRGRRLVSQRPAKARILLPGLCHLLHHVLKRMGQYGLAVVSLWGRRTRRRMANNEQRHVPHRFSRATSFTCLELY